MALEPSTTRQPLVLVSVTPVPPPDSPEPPEEDASPVSSPSAAAEPAAVVARDPPLVDTGVRALAGTAGPATATGCSVPAGTGPDPGRMYDANTANNDCAGAGPTGDTNRGAAIPVDASSTPNTDSTGVAPPTPGATAAGPDGSNVIRFPRNGTDAAASATAPRAVARVASFIVSLTPYGLFAIAAVTAGTFDPKQAVQVEVYLITFVSVSMLLTLWVLPGLVAALTPVPHVAVLSRATARARSVPAVGAGGRRAGQRCRDCVRGDRWSPGVAPYKKRGAS